MPRAAPRTANPALDLGADAGERWAEGYGLAHSAARDEAVRSCCFLCHRSLSSVRCALAHIHTLHTPLSLGSSA